MERSTSSRIIKSASALLAVVIIVVAILLYNQKRKIEEHKEAVLKETILFNEAYLERCSDFLAYADTCFKAKEAEIDKRENDYTRYMTDSYGAAHISMWNIDALQESSYPEFFGYPIIYADYNYKTPSELKAYLETIVESGNNLQHIYINIDPYQLELNYNEAVRYDDNPPPFEEYIHNEILSIFNDYPELSFELFLPARPTSYWASLWADEYNTIMDKWYVFLMYLHWCPNVKVRYLGDQEWLVSNDYNYANSERFTDEMMKKAYMYLYAYVEYEITPPELKQKKGLIYKYISKLMYGGYNVCDLSDKKVVFLGDSLFDYIEVDSAAVPGAVKRFSGAECYNLSIGGTMASGIDSLGFTRIANSLSMKSVLDYDSRYKREAERFLSDYSEDDSLVFVILYGMNDSIGNVPITEDDIVPAAATSTDSESDDAATDTVEYKPEDTFINSVTYGIELLKKSYPNAEILLLSPYPPRGQNGGKEPFVEGGHALTDYVDALKTISKDEGIYYYDLFHKGPIKASTWSEYLADGTHTNEKGAFTLGETIARTIDEKINGEADN